MNNPRIENLTANEMIVFKELTSGYGSITDAANITGLHIHTIRAIRRLGFAKPETISIIRKKLLKQAKQAV